MNQISTTCINFYFRLDEDGKVLTPEEILYRVCYKKAKHVNKIRIWVSTSFMDFRYIKVQL